MATMTGSTLRTAERLTIEVPIVTAKDLKGCVQGVLPSLFARVQLLDGLQELAEAVVGQPLPAWYMGYVQSMVAFYCQHQYTKSCMPKPIFSLHNASTG